MSRAPKPFKRAGLHKVACYDCRSYAYATVAQLETFGLLACPACGDRMVPDELDLALLLGLEDLPIVAEWRRIAANKEASQRRSLGWNEASMRHSLGTLSDMSVAAADQMRAERRARARSNRLAALKPAAEPIPF